MKNKITLGFAALIMTAIISSCSTSNDVASNKRIQKRKYNKGFFVSKNENVAFNKKKKDAKTIEFNDTETLTSSEAQVDKTVKTSEVSVIEETAVVKPLLKVKTTKVIHESTNEVASKNEVIAEDVNIKDVKTVEIKNVNKSTKSKTRLSKKEKSASGGDEMLILLVILCFLIPVIAVGLKTDWDLTKVLISLILMLLFWVPGVIYALLVVFDVI